MAPILTDNKQEKLLLKFSAEKITASSILKALGREGRWQGFSWIIRARNAGRVNYECHNFRVGETQKKEGNRG